ncbi:helix-turn-helix domain-containing protein [Noviherbaspirillum saxi]|uniref:XRE family transcriptional regulator n=1 Tax=Noviherbaspirillum saxi TaxID=2320863 RepID=A0A3A3FMU5_9BURK|nr:helix-turn-helix transcriptional regulator [Noviherbaspirillum saxi]RJF96051.1 XRE family transcriptional regulator [Noviherbaspirillum saxi]
MDLIQIGLEIKKARLEKGVQQEELCAFAEISRATLSRLENGRLAELGIRKIMRVCERLALELTLQPVRKRPTLRSLAMESAEQLRSRHALSAMGPRGPKNAAWAETTSPQPDEAITSLRKRVRRPKKAKESEE